MVDYPAYNQALLAKFVEGNVQTKIIQLYKNINVFIEENAPILEEIQQKLDNLNRTPFGKISRNLIELDIRVDLNGAKKGLSAYNRMFGRLDLYLGLMTSNFKLPQFLAENNVSPEQIRFFQQELRTYWEVVYGYHIDHLERCLKILDELRQTLQKEIEILETIPGQSYLEALDENEKIKTLFDLERAKFFELIETSKLQNEETSKIKALVSAQITKTQAMVKVLTARQKANLSKDLLESRTNLEKALITLIFLLGGLNILLSIPKNLKKRAFDKIWGKITSITDEERLSLEGKRLFEEAQELLFDTATVF